MIERESKQVDKKFVACKEVFVPKPPVELEGKDKKSVRIEEQRKVLLKKAEDKMNDQNRAQNHNSIDSGLRKKVIDKENEELMEEKKRQQELSDIQKSKYADMVRAQCEDDMRNDLEICCKKQLENRMAADSWINEMREKDQQKLKEKLEKQKGSERRRTLEAQYREEDKQEALQKAHKNRIKTKNHLEEIARVEYHKERRAEMSRAEVERVNRDWMEIDLRNLQRKREQANRRSAHRTDLWKIVEPLKKEQATTTAPREQRIPRDIEATLKRLEQQDLKEKAAAQQAIATERQRQIQDKKLRQEAEHERNLNWFQFNMERDKIHLELDNMKAKKAREDRVAMDKCNEIYGAQKRAHLLAQKKEDERWGTPAGRAGYFSMFKL
ncbi:hypothetical protein PBY51_017068 [Eleginops maclovinus]|uniref:Trichohyalin-plectin-homology domain-containing protein n=1 Tax=Eleginops maclovinus TaxID=56733 RepID=A0AAN7WA39_ELEMC|nr:hypothetical protein PBY51_017068 [Eleginops maclovinus]